VPNRVVRGETGWRLMWVVFQGVSGCVVRGENGTVDNRIVVNYFAVFGPVPNDTMIFVSRKCRLATGSNRGFAHPIVKLPCTYQVAELVLKNILTH